VGKRTSYEPGTFSWADLATTDPDGAKAFYAGLFGWEFEDLPAGEGMTYTMVTLGGDRVAALARGREGIPPHWNSYVTVASADDAATRAGELGAQVLFPPFDVMDAGRMATVQDPAGAIFQVWEPRDSIGAERVNETGCLTWNDLSTVDPEGADRFYSGLFGWSFEKVPGPVDYWVIQNGGRSNGGMRRQDQKDEVEAGIPPNWMPYFAVSQVGELGGSVVVPPSPVPTGRLAVFTDPQGAAFAVFEGEFDE
jgi:predicted enzyme related to lactoylglutathione lyase